MTPGPGMYNNSGATKAQGPNIKFGTSKRADNLTKNTSDQPGPGNYSVEYKPQGGFKMG